MTSRASCLPCHHREAAEARLPPLARLVAVLVLVMGLAPAVMAATSGPRHGLSAFGDLKYPADFKHFSYVNPDAPKGGRLSMIGTSGLNTFDSFNAFILKGDAAEGLTLLFDSLMVRAADEPDAMYGLVARTAEVAADGKSVVFKLRPEARFSDGTPVTAEDVAFTFATLKEKGHPGFRLVLADVVAADVLDAHTVRYRFQGTLTRDLPLTVAGLPIFSKAYYTKIDFAQTSLVPPLGSGPYTIASHGQGAFIQYKRRTDYWARDLPVNRGRFNFDEIRYEYYRDRTAELQALKAGTYDLREEFTSRDWALAYDLPQIRDGRLVKLTLPDESPSGAQGFFLNMRRPALKDVRVRKALDLAFDFEWTNKNLFYSLYRRTWSFFQNSDMMASGKPSAEELALLEPFRAQLPPEVFGEPYRPPVTNGSGQDRSKLREAAKLLAAAGYTYRGNRLVDSKGQVLRLEILLFSPSFERVVTPYIRNLRALGIDAFLRRVDTAQYQRRLKSFDFDITVQRYVMRLTPGNELDTYLSSRAAGMSGSRNLAGLASPVVDALIKKVIEARNRPQLLAATRALDRVLRAQHIWVPHWYKAAHNIAHWNKFGRPSEKPRFARGVVDTWWYDAAKAQALRAK
ncbi:MAG: extracellular solute-binding protein [Hyphomicrobiaceae bacterium]